MRASHSLFVDDQRNERSFLNICANVANEAENYHRVCAYGIAPKNHHHTPKEVRNLIMLILVLLNLPTNNPIFINVRYLLALH
jgi:hypothetical protein